MVMQLLVEFFRSCLHVGMVFLLAFCLFTGIHDGECVSCCLSGISHGRPSWNTRGEKFVIPRGDGYKFLGNSVWGRLHMYRKLRL